MSEELVTQTALLARHSGILGNAQIQNPHLARVTLEVPGAKL